MATTSGSSCSELRNSSSEEHLQQIKEQRKRKRMISNRESARRSGQRKQKLIDDLTGQVGQLEQDINQISATIEMKAQVYHNIEAENAVLRAQMAELNQRLQSLDEITSFLSTNNGGVFDEQFGCFDSCITPWSSLLFV